MAEFHAVSRQGWKRQIEEEEEGKERKFLLAVSVLQIKMWVEVDEDLLPRLWGSYDPHALLGGRVRAGIPRGGQVLRDVDLYVSSAFICSTETHFDLTSTL